MDVVGYLMMAAPFIALFVWGGLKIGIRDVSIIFVLSLVTLLWIALAQYFIGLS